MKSLEWVKEHLFKSLIPDGRVDTWCEDAKAKPPAIYKFGLIYGFFLSQHEGTISAVAAQRRCIWPCPW